MAWISVFLIAFALIHRIECYRISMEAIDNIKDDDPMSDNVKFYLFTRLNPNIYQSLEIENVTTVKSSNFDSTHRTTIVVHGYMSNIQSDLDKYIKNDMLNLEDHNVIGVDWSALSETILYNKAAEATLKVGQYVGQFINFMISEGSLDLESTHLIGHSLGAHIVGFAGKTIAPKRLPRITGLDPAKPSFEDAGPTARLDKTDADFVDCIHTCAGGLGLGKPICTADFYPNGGTNYQPGCPMIDVFGVCSHGRSYAYYAESIMPGHIFPTQQCSQVPLDGPSKYCYPSQALMGYPSSPSYPGIFYAKTNSEFPFAPIVKTKPHRTK